MLTRRLTHTTETAASAAALAVALGVGLAVGPTTAAWGESAADGTSRELTSAGKETTPGPAPSHKRATIPTYSTYVKRADAALSRAINEIRADHPVRANKALDRLTNNTRRANVGATATIGKPPSDPESDDLPGPPAVTSVIALDHRIGRQLIPRFDGFRRPVVSEHLRVALWAAYHQRGVILDKVIALPPEGAGEDYADGLSDTLPVYGQDVSQLTQPSGPIG